MEGNADKGKLIKAKFAVNSNTSDISLSSILLFNSELCDLIRKYYGEVK
jgi:hypothetical protein